MGWTWIARAIIGRQGEFSKFIKQAQRWKKKEQGKANIYYKNYESHIQSNKFLFIEFNNKKINLK